MMNFLSSSSTYDSMEALGAFFGLFTFAYIFCMAIMIVSIIALAKIFKKAGIAAWKVLIPYYNLYLLCQIVLGNGWLFLLTLIPGFGAVYTYIIEYKLCRAFGKDTGFCILSLFFSPVTRLILAFGDSEYVGPAE